MSRLYDTVEPTVIDDDMLSKAIYEQGPKDEAGRIAKEEGINFSDVKSLRLDFKNILKIDNLWCFKSVTKLQLDNNIIERIEGLDHMVHLQWLDLSFNNIEAIEGLDNLIFLEDLTLFNNRISKIENMDMLKNLQVFSIGNNKLTDLENLLYLRKLPKLQTLNVRGNPFCKEKEFLPYTLAFVSQLVFLDYKLIDNSARADAQETYSIKIEEIQVDERSAENKIMEAQALVQKLQRHTAAYVENLDGDFLFESMYAEDVDGMTLNEMIGMEDLMITFKEKFVDICRQLFEFGLLEFDKRKEEVAAFFECINEAKNENKIEGQNIINEFLAYKRRLFEDLQVSKDNKSSEEMLNEYNNQVNLLWDKLMGVELQLVDQLEEAIKDFERNLEDLTSAFIENVQALMAQCRESENLHYERVSELAIVTLEKALKNELEDEMSEELRMLLIDKDTVVNALQQSHDLHLLKIDNREDDIVKRMRDWRQNLLDKLLLEEEIKRNRSRVSEINNLVDHLREEAENIDLPDATY